MKTTERERLNAIQRRMDTWHHGLVPVPSDDWMDGILALHEPLRREVILVLGIGVTITNRIYERWETLWQRSEAQFPGDEEEAEDLDAALAGLFEQISDVQWAEDAEDYEESTDVLKQSIKTLLDEDEWRRMGLE